MNASRIAPLALALILLSGCGGTTQELSPEDRPQLYRTAI